MSTYIMAKCWPLQMPPTPKAVLISLADNANDAGVCWPSIPTICERTCLSERTVHGAIKWLEGNGILRADRSNGRHTRYFVCVSRDEPPQELRPRSNCAPAGNAQTPANAAGDPRRSCGTPPQELRSNRKEPSLEATVKEPKARAGALPRPDGVSEQTWADWLRLRKDKRATVSQTVVDGAIEEATKAGLTLESFLRVWCLRGSQGLQADWLKPHERGTNPPAANQPYRAGGGRKELP